MPLNSWSQASARETLSSYRPSPATPITINNQPSFETLRAMVSSRCGGSRTLIGMNLRTERQDKKYSISSIATPTTTARVANVSFRKYSSLDAWKLALTAASNWRNSSGEIDIDTRQTEILIDFLWCMAVIGLIQVAIICAGGYCCLLGHENRGTDGTFS